MLGFVLIYWIGKYFYQLAGDFKKNNWLFAILGIVVYYVGTFIGGLILGILDIMFDWNFDWDNDVMISLLALPFGLLSCYVFYVLLEKYWKKNVVEIKDSIHEIGRSEEDFGS